MAQFSVSSGILELGVLDSEVAYCVSDLNVTYSTESLGFLCMDANTPVKFPGAEEWSGSATLAYDDGGMNTLRGFSGHLVFTVVTSTGNSIELEGDVVISSSDSNFSKTSVPTMEISFDGSGDLGETVTP